MSPYFDSTSESNIDLKMYKTQKTTPIIGNLSLFTLFLNIWNSAYSVHSVVNGVEDLEPFDKTFMKCFPDCDN